MSRRSDAAETAKQLSRAVVGVTRAIASSGVVDAMREFKRATEMSAGVVPMESRFKPRIEHGRDLEPGDLDEAEREIAGALASLDPKIRL